METKEPRRKREKEGGKGGREKGEGGNGHQASASFVRDQLKERDREMGRE